MADPVAVGVDVGGTKLLALAVSEDGEIVRRARITTPRDDRDAFVQAIADAAREVASDVPVGVGVAGTVSREGELRFGTNLGINDLPLASRLHDQLDVPVTVRNDGTVALYGEAKVGAAAGEPNVLMLTLGTGVGGAILADGALVEGETGMGGEVGHIVIEDGGRPCPCGSNGCLEVYASGSAIGVLAQERLGAGGTPSSLEDIDVVDGKAVTLAARDGDELAVSVLRDVGRWLGVGLTSLVNVLDPSTVVVGGGAAPLAAPILLPEAESVMRERIIGSAHRDPPRVVVAALGDDAGAIGAALLAVDVARG